MKKIFLIAMMALLAIPAFAQEPESKPAQETESQTVVKQKKGRVPSEKKCAIEVGFLNGGGGLVGVDFEYLIVSHLSVQGGVGLTSFGGAINYHFKPFINSSMISLVYMHQGVGNSYTASWLGPMYTFRAPKIFQVSGGLGLKVGDGPAATTESKKSSASLLFTIGVYFPI